MNNFLCLLITIILFITNGFAQTGTGSTGPIIEINFKLKKIEFINQNFSSEIDSLVLKSDCPNLKIEKNKYFLVRFINDSECVSSHKVFFELVQTPLESGDNIGYFCINDYVFIISGDVPENFIIFTNEAKEFTSRRGKYFVVECFPSWLFFLRNNQLVDLIEMDCWDY